jgi:heterodisulfide reductase subunit C2
MTIRIKRGENHGGLLHTVEQMSNVDLGLCLQCKKCASGCPVSGLAGSPPFEIIRRLHLGAGDELLESGLIWLCASCETCYARCPMGIDIAALMDALRVLSVEKGIRAPEGGVPFFNNAFLQTVRIFGRVYDMAMLTAYRMKTFSLKKDENNKFKFMKDVDKFPTLLKKRKIALLPSMGASRGLVLKIFRAMERNREHN